MTFYAFVVIGFMATLIAWALEHIGWKYVATFFVSVGLLVHLAKRAVRLFFK